MLVRTKKHVPPAAILFAATWLAASAAFVDTACAQEPGALRLPPTRDAGGWMPDVRVRLDRLASDRRRADAAPQSATSAGDGEPPWWWLPCPAPDEARP